jgi:hypothetical protein
MRRVCLVKAHTTKNPIAPPTTKAAVSDQSKWSLSANSKAKSAALTFVKGAQRRVPLKNLKFSHGNDYSFAQNSGKTEGVR